MGHPGGPDSGGTNRDLGIPGDHLGGPGDVRFTAEERVFHDTLTARICRYCERKFNFTKQSQKFHDNRCGLMYSQGKIADETFRRWEKGLHELQHWYEGGDDDFFENRPADPLNDPDWNPGPYRRSQDVMQFDQARRRFYLTILEIQKRAERSRAVEALRAYKMLADALLELFAMPADFSLDALSSGYFSDTNKHLNIEPGYDITSPLPKRGMEGWAILTKTYDDRLRKHFKMTMGLDADQFMA